MRNTVSVGRKSRRAEKMPRRNVLPAPDLSHAWTCHLPAFLMAGNDDALGDATRTPGSNPARSRLGKKVFTARRDFRPTGPCVSHRPFAASPSTLPPSFARSTVRQPGSASRRLFTNHQSLITSHTHCGMACAGTPPLSTTRRARARIPRQYLRGNRPIPIMASWLATKASNGPNA